MKKVTAFSLALLGLSLFPTIVFAQQTATQSARTDGSLTVSPAYIEVTLEKPGEVQSLPLIYTNNSSRPVTVEMFPLNFNYTDANGTIGFLNQNSQSYSYSLASYLSLQSNQIQIDPKESIEFTVEVTNRPDLTPGGHYGAIIAKVIPGIEGDLGAQVAPSLSTLIFLRKTGGERYNLSLKQTGEEGSIAITLPDSVSLEFQNEGNVHLVPYGTVQITDIFGRVLKEGTLNTSSFLVMPESRRTITVDLRKRSMTLPISIDTLTVRGTDSLKKTTFLYRNTFFYIDPYLVLGFMAVFLLILFLRKRRNVRKIKYEQNNEIKPYAIDKRIRKREKKI